ncbi:MAG: MFS transporter, partial [Aquabacterium sp.]|nr:MFS transporter [Aquabacterium sp.]
MSHALPPSRMSQALWAFLVGNFFIGCGVMVVSGGLNDLLHDLNIA